MTVVATLMHESLSVKCGRTKGLCSIMFHSKVGVGEVVGNVHGVFAFR